jgi:hypothetical protein
MKRFNFLIITFLSGSLLYGEQAGQKTTEKKPAPGAFSLTVGESILSNTLLYLADRYIAKEAWTLISAASIWENLTGPWEWDRDEYFTNQFGHPYQGSTYHAAARSNGFTFYQGMLFDIFGSVQWELFCETNKPSLNDLISTTLGGAVLGEMFHRLYLEIHNPLATVISPMDAFNGMITRRRPQYTRNIYSLCLAFATGYMYAEQTSEQKKNGALYNLNTRHMASKDLARTIVYGNPFIQQSRQPYEHFELFLYINFGYPFWYNLKLLYSPLVKVVLSPASSIMSQPTFLSSSHTLSTTSFLIPSQFFHHLFYQTIRLHLIICPFWTSLTV